MNVPECNSCFFFSHNTQRTGYSVGACHRFPPADVSEGRFAEHPVVKSSNWCGEFKLPPGPTLAEMLRGEK